MHGAGRSGDSQMSNKGDFRPKHRYASSTAALKRGYRGNSHTNARAPSAASRTREFRGINKCETI